MQDPLVMKPGETTLGRVDLPSPPTAVIQESHNPHSAAYYSRIKELEGRVRFLERSLRFLGDVDSGRLRIFRYHRTGGVAIARGMDKWDGASLEEALGKALRAESQRPG